MRPQVLKDSSTSCTLGMDISIWTSNILRVDQGGGKSCLEATWGGDLYTFHPHKASKWARFTPGQYLALAVPFGRWRIPHSFEDEEEMIALPPRQQQLKAPFLPRDGWAGTALGHPGVKDLPRQLPE